MAQPTPYVPATNFQQEETSAVAGRSTVRTSRVDAELQAVSLTLSQILTNLALIQRDDTQLNDLVVTTASLSANVKALFAGGINPRGIWLTATAYAVKDVVETLSPLISYVCVIAHTSGTFATDRAAGKWMVLGSEPGSVVLTDLTLSTGGITLSTNNTQDLAATANRFRSGYFGTTVFAGTSVVTPLLTAAGDVTISTGGTVRTIILSAANNNLGPSAAMDLGTATLRWGTAYLSALDSGTAAAISLKTNNGTKQAEFAHVATAVNYLQLGGAAAGVAPSFGPLGADTDIGLRIFSKGAGTISFMSDTAGATQFQVLRTASSSRNITVTGSNGGNPTIDVTGGSLAITPAVVIAGASLSVGTNPASAGAIRLSTTGVLAIRNNANSGDVTICGLATMNGVTNIVLLNQSGTGIVGNARQKAGAPAVADLPTDGMWTVWRDTAGNTTKVYYNNAGAIIASAAFA